MFEDVLLLHASLALLLRRERGIKPLVHPRYRLLVDGFHRACPDQQFFIGGGPF